MSGVRTGERVDGDKNSVGETSAPIDPTIYSLNVVTLLGLLAFYVKIPSNNSLFLFVLVLLLTERRGPSFKLVFVL